MSTDGQEADDCEGAAFPFNPISMPIQRRLRGYVEKQSSAYRQISTFFHSPVPSLFCGAADNGWELGGMLMEYQLRAVIKADKGGSFPLSIGWKDVPTALSRWIRYSSMLNGGAEPVRSSKRRRRHTDTYGNMNGKDSPSHYSSSTRRGIPPIAGRFAEEKAELWTGGAEVETLYEKKHFLSAGIYSSRYKGESDEHDDSSAETFSWPLPRDYGKDILETEAEFELPFDLFTDIESSGGPMAMRMKLIRKLPSPFIRISRNIFVDRKPFKVKEVPICQCSPVPEGQTTCGERCLNRCMFIECSPKHCPGGAQCSNQRFQSKEQVKGIDVVWTAVRGYGLLTTVNIPRGTLVIEYRGEIISQDTCIERMETIYNGVENYYFLNYARNEVIDACRKGTEARFINHSCQPNCHIEKWLVDGEYRVALFTSEDIFAGSELTYDYKFEAFGPMQACLCGASLCRGFIGLNKKPEKVKAALQIPKTSSPSSKRFIKKPVAAKRTLKTVTTHVPIERPQRVSPNIYLRRNLKQSDDGKDATTTTVTTPTGKSGQQQQQKPKSKRLQQILSRLTEGDDTGSVLSSESNTKKKATTVSDGKSSGPAENITPGRKRPLRACVSYYYQNENLPPLLM